MRRSLRRIKVLLKSAAARCLLFQFMFTMYTAGAAYTQAPINFADPMMTETGDKPHAVVVADFDNDSWLDAALVNLGTNDLFVYHNTGFGNLVVCDTEFCPSAPYDIDTVEINGDGYVDLASVSAADSSLYLWRNIGDGTFEGDTVVHVPGMPLRICCGELDLGDHSELILTYQNRPFIDIFTIDSGGRLQLSTSIACSMNTYEAICVDYDGDGDQDIATTCYADGYLRIYLNDGSGAFSEGPRANVGGPLWAIASGDLNGDSHPDFAVGRYYDGSFCLVLNLSDSLEIDKAGPYSVGDEITALSSADLDEDGDNDLVVSYGTPTSGAFRVYSNDGAGVLAEAGTLNAGRNHLKIANLDNAGAPDVVANCFTSGDLKVYLNITLPRVIHVPGDLGTIQVAIDHAVDGDTVLVAPGTYQELIDFKGKSICLKSENGCDSTILTYSTPIPDTSLISLTNGEDTTTTIDGFTIQDIVYGRTLVHLNASSCNILRCMIRNNENAYTGRGDWGVIRANNGGQLRVDRCTISDNVGSGLAITRGYGIFTNNTIIGNLAVGEGQGGGIGVAGMGGEVTALVKDNLIVGNRGHYGGGLFLSRCPNTIVINNTFVGNFAEDGGAICFFYQCSGLLVEDNLFVRNESFAVTNPSSSLVDMDCNDAFQNLPLDYSSGISPGPNSFSLDPLLCDTTAGDYHLEFESPCAAGGASNPCGVLIGALEATCTALPDADGDGIPDEYDACTDTDGDGFGDSGFPSNTCSIDNCPDTPNEGQVDADGDGVGDECDNCQYTANPQQEDSDADGIGDSCDVCLGFDDNVDTDSDGVPDGCDNCQSVANPMQADLDGDGIGDACDPDIDGDGIANEADNCRLTYNADQSDIDDDGIGDLCDNCPSFANHSQIDTDSDGVGDPCDACPGFDDREDIDQDAVPDSCDNCLTIPNVGQEDNDQNGVGNACCCGQYTVGYTGNADCDAEGKMTLADITRLIDRTYLSKQCLCCEANGNVDGDGEGKMNLADITKLIDHVYLSKESTAVCP